MMDFVSVTLILIGLATAWAFNVILLYLFLKLERRVEFLEEWSDIRFEIMLEEDEDEGDF